MMLKKHYWKRSEPPFIQKVVFKMISGVISKERDLIFSLSIHLKDSMIEKVIRMPKFLNVTIDNFEIHFSGFGKMKIVGVPS